ncbi:Senescence-specific cysteine protease SAG39 [Seminavis robusta]|uniref:Senescence-specific cysteine protease SAG39 n=1 Tax=Seminavis robusta TaxID=568900 RepID=A0A9N8HXQ3_9STRA|nr:Senescence-specific cysteine protease SAG39 [Seminavis robusta]|eukprot:Sro1847_g301410.1 Senescence-specific cysteine protease SAG39 (417) ;mRNA; r:5460-7021
MRNLTPPWTMLRLSLLLLVLPVLVVVATTTTTTTTTTSSLSDDDFHNWLSVHSKSYSNNTSNLDEWKHRFSIFQENARLVQRHNDAFAKGETSFTMTIDGPFADLTDQEFTQLYLMDSQDCSATHRSSGKLHTASIDSTIDSGPYDIDWRTKGILTAVKNQGACGSCWTFSTTGCLEAHTCLAQNRDCTHWLGLAEQQLVDCAQDFNNHGCNGGLPSQAYEYIKYNGGIDLETSYLYVANKTDGTCKAKDFTIGAQVAGVYNITSRDEDDLMHAIATLGPVSIAYQVSPDFRLYQHGVYDSYNATTKKIMCKSDNHHVNHAVVAVGMGQTAKTKDLPVTPFYIVRNSWGTSWGMEGHFWMKRGENLCGVSDCASFPLVPKTKQKDGQDAAGGTSAETTTKIITTTHNAALLRGSSE